MIQHSLMIFLVSVGLTGEAGELDPGIRGGAFVEVRPSPHPSEQGDSMFPETEIFLS